VRLGYVLLGAILALALAACGGVSNAAEPEQPTAPLPTETSVAVPATIPATAAEGPCESAVAWSITFEVSGGLAGMDRTLSLDSEGKAVAADVRKGTEASASLTDEQVARVGALLQTLCPFESTRRKTICADCLSYELVIQWGDQSFRLSATDVTLAEQRLEPLVSELNALLGEVLKNGT